MSERTEGTSGAAPGTAPGVALVGYAPITRVDAERREIELCATSEALDAHGTIFDYAASKDAFTRWLGNVREMHERRAVGRRVAVRCDDEARRVYVRLRISRGAQDTWEKVLDGTLRGASIGASEVVWRRERRAVAGRSRWVNVATRYELAELSLVDNPSNPDALGVTFVRDAAPDVTLLDPLEAEQPDDAAAEHTETREESPETSAETSAESSAGERQPLHTATRALLAGCGCALCEMALATLAEDQPRQGGEGAALTRTLAAGLERMDATLRELVQVTQQVERAAQVMRVGDDERRTDERAEAQAARVVEELRERVARLEAQPAPGGPAARAVAVDRALGPGATAPADEFRALEALAGRLRDPQAQLAVAAEMIRLQQRAGGE